MKKPRFSRPLLVTFSAIVILLCLLFTVVTTQNAHAILPVSSDGPKATILHSHFMYSTAKKVSAGQLPCLGSTTVPLCYSPQQIRRAYDVQPLLDAGITGKGRSIVIVDAYQSPTLVSDVKLFDKTFGLKDPKLNIIAPFGLKAFDSTDPNATSFAGEISLDVEWAHAIAPDATINLVLANPADNALRSQLDSLISASQYAVTNNLGDVLSLSVGIGETCYSPTEISKWHKVFAAARLKKIAAFVSSGDSGAAALQCDSAGNPVGIGQGVEYPASDPLVSGVGGTTLLATQAGVYRNEKAWNTASVNGGATGGGLSSLFARPAYQSGVLGVGKKRGVPDIAYNADPGTGFPVVVSSLVPGSTLLIPVGGTSAGAPQVAAIAALSDQLALRRLGFLNGAFYRISASAVYHKGFHDITTGNNTFTAQNGSGKAVTIPGFAAGPGWDPVTGVGTPKAFQLASLLSWNVNNNDGSGL